MKILVALEKTKLKVEFTGNRQSVRIKNGWTDWMIRMDDIRDMIIAIDNSMVDRLFKLLTDKFKKINFIETGNKEEAILPTGKKIIRRVNPGLRRKEYQTIALFIRNKSNKCPPSPIEISLEELAKLMIAFVTVDKPPQYCVKDSLRNYQYLLSILWMKKTDEKLLKGEKKLSSQNIFRLGIP